jgi:hypothetical protein
MKFLFTCPETYKEVETDAFGIIEDKGIRMNPSGQKAWKARIELSAPCPQCGGLHTYKAEALPCSFNSPAD